MLRNIGRHSQEREENLVAFSLLTISMRLVAWLLSSTRVLQGTWQPCLRHILPWPWFTFYRRAVSHASRVATHMPACNSRFLHSHASDAAPVWDQLLLLEESPGDGTADLLLAAWAQPVLELTPALSSVAVCVLPPPMKQVDYVAVWSKSMHGRTWCSEGLWTVMRLRGLDGTRNSRKQLETRY